MMRSKLCLLSLLALACVLPACAMEPGSAATQSPSSSVLETDDQKVLYALGQVLGQNIASAGLSESELAPVILGLSDSALQRDPKVDLAQYGPLLQDFMEQRIEAASAAELNESMAFIDQQAQTEGAVRTGSGLIIQEMRPGTGARPSATDVVRVHYHGTLRDGSVFDSSVERGEPATFALNQVIPCWTEGLQSVQVGGKSRLVCPPDLAYGSSGPPGIPPNSALVFEVELLEIVGN